MSQVDVLKYLKENRGWKTIKDMDADMEWIATGTITTNLFKLRKGKHPHIAFRQASKPFGRYKQINQYKWID